MFDLNSTLVRSKILDKKSFIKTLLHLLVENAYCSISRVLLKRRIKFLLEKSFARTEDPLADRDSNRRLRHPPTSPPASSEWWQEVSSALSPGNRSGCSRRSRNKAGREDGPRRRILERTRRGCRDRTG